MAGRAPGWLSGHPGRRGSFLVVMGLGMICWGVGMVVEPPLPDGLHLLTRIAPLHCWAGVWVLSGLVTFTSAWLSLIQVDDEIHHRGIAPPHDRIRHLHHPTRVRDMAARVPEDRDTGADPEHWRPPVRSASPR
jgi:hypothetical protein